MVAQNLQWKSSLLKQRKDEILTFIQKTINTNDMSIINRSMYTLQKKENFTQANSNLKRKIPFILRKNPNPYVPFYPFSKNHISITFVNSSPWIYVLKLSFSKNIICHFLNFFSNKSTLPRISSCKEQIWCNKLR